MADCFLSSTSNLLEITKIQCLTLMLIDTMRRHMNNCKLMGIASLVQTAVFCLNAQKD